MDKIIIRKYCKADRDTWNRMVNASRNGTFLLLRDYMEYHSDRFHDCSLIALCGDKPIALLPANLTTDGVLHSHQGLTYGGWVLPMGNIDGAGVLRIFNATTEWCRAQGIHEIDYKPIPGIYHRQTSQDDIYALWRLGATCSSVNLSSTIDLANDTGFSNMQRRLLRKGKTSECIISESTHVNQFWHILNACLHERHATTPVHSAAELQMLRDLFPENIRIFTASINGEAHAGVAIYDTRMVSHAQYIASTNVGRELHLLPVLFHHLIDRARNEGKRYFDFGISCEQGGLVLNEGLLNQKHGLGGTGSIYSRFTLTL